MDKELKDYFYYGFRSQKRQESTKFEDDLRVLEEILSSKKILNKNGLNRKLGFFQRIKQKLSPDVLNWQGADSVSVCTHPLSYVKAQDIQKAEERDWHKAFPYFVGNCLSFILSDEILKNVKPSVQKAMHDEIQVNGDIPIEYIIGLGVPSQYIEKYGSKDSILRIREILKKYNLKIPIYDVVNNKEYTFEKSENDIETKDVNESKKEAETNNVLEKTVNSKNELELLNIKPIAKDENVVLAKQDAKEKVSKLQEELIIDDKNKSEKYE